MDYHQINWLDSNQTIYGLDGKKIKVTYRVETIKVKNKPDVIDSVRYTFWGPVVDDDKDLALRWLAHDAATGPEIQTFVKVVTQNVIIIIHNVHFVETKLV